MDRLILDMRKTPQTDTQSVWDHGVAVSQKYKELLAHLREGTPLSSEWRLPDWIEDNKEFILDNLLPDDVMRQYHIYHDCGKPYCIKYDDEGRKHFPNHAEVSYETYLDVFGSKGNHQTVADLIRHDMDVHVMKAADVESFCKEMGSRKAVSLLITALCEIHANAEMFGGINSTSFKIKYKQINKRGKAIINFLKEQENENNEGNDQRNDRTAKAVQSAA